MRKPTFLKNATCGLAALTLSAALLAGCSDSSMSYSANSTRDTKHQSGHADGMTMGGKGIDSLKNLKGREFDIAYLSLMIAHHQAAVDMAKQTQKLAIKAETKQEAQAVIASQTGEIQQMTAWLKQWYDVAPSSQQQGLMHEDMKDMMARPIDNDRMFFEMMIPHHQGAIEMSELAASRSEKAELKSLAQEIIHAQTAEIEKYKSLQP